MNRKIVVWIIVMILLVNFATTQNGETEWGEWDNLKKFESDISRFLAEMGLNSIITANNSS